MVLNRLRKGLVTIGQLAMDSARDAERAVQSFAVQPSLLRRVREPDPDWIHPPEFDLGWDVDTLEEDELYAFLSESLVALYTLH